VAGGVGWKLAKLYNAAVDSLELMGIVKRVGGRVAVNEPVLAARLEPCFALMRTVFEALGILGRVRERAGRNPLGAAAQTLAYCTYFELSEKTTGRPPDIVGFFMKWDEEREAFILVLAALLMTLMKEAFMEEKVVELFKAAFDA